MKTWHVMPDEHDVEGERRRRRVGEAALDETDDPAVVVGGEELEVVPPREHERDDGDRDVEPDQQTVRAPHPGLRPVRRRRRLVRWPRP
jgi:hypothetical protein